MSRNSKIKTWQAIKQRVASFDIRHPGFEGVSIVSAASLLLVSCAQTDLTKNYADRSTVANVEVLPDGNLNPVKVQTAYGLMNLGQVLKVDGKLLYVSASGLLPVEFDQNAVASNPVINLSGSDGSQLANVAPENRSVIQTSARTAPPKPGIKGSQPVSLPDSTTASIDRSGNLKGASGKDPQFVMLAFDGSRSLYMWEDTRRFARQQNISFTYFISGVYFLSEKNKTKYKGPGFKRGVSHIGWARTSGEVEARLDQVNAALDEGHEIASHANGHFDGSKWSYDDWHSELTQFQSIMKNAYSNNGLSEPGNWRSRVKNRMFKGFRAPLLGTSKGMWPALRQFGYTYDTSRTAPKNYWPKKENGVYNFPLGHVKTAHKGVNTISMDYNFYVAQSGGKPRPSRAKAFEDEMFDTYMDYFNRNYKGNRAPVHIGHHFSLWNAGAYWRAMKRFSKAVCGKPEVRCATYQELERYMRFRSGNKSVASAG